MWVEKIGSFACIGIAWECVASKCANERWPLHCPAALCITKKCFIRNPSKKVVVIG